MIPATSPARRALARFGRALYPFEWAALGGLALGVGFLRWKGLHVDGVAVGYTVPPLLRPIAVALAGGVALQVVYRLVTRSSARHYLSEVLTLRWLRLSARIWLACIVFTFTYFWMKVSVPLVNWAAWDAELWNLDRALHLGLSPSVFLVTLVDGTILAPMLDAWYGEWILTMMFGLGFFCAAPEPLVRRRFILSTVLMWTLGAWLYTAVPAVGPVYTHPEIWQSAESPMESARRGQAALWENYTRVLEGRSEPLRRFNPTRGVAAFPSLHVAGHWLLMLWARRAYRPLFVPFAIAAGLTFLGSIVTGWHYAVDGYAGILLAQGVFWLGLQLDSRPG